MSLSDLQSELSTSPLHQYCELIIGSLTSLTPIQKSDSAHSTFFCSDSAPNKVLLSGAVLMAAGGGLIKAPLYVIDVLKPLTTEIEARAGLTSVSASARGSAPLLAMIGGLLFLQGFQYLMAVYTVDEKAKRNSVSTRFIYAFTCYYTIAKTSHGSSLIALFGLFNIVSAFLLGLTVGFGDGNAVDLEIAEEEAKKSAKALKAKGKAN